MEQKTKRQTNLRPSGWKANVRMTRLITVTACLTLILGAFVASPPSRAAVVINEINYHPDTDAEREEYVELYNTGATSVTLTNWRFVQGITYTFAPGTILPSHGYLVVARDRARIISLFGIANVVGDFTGQLDNGGEWVTLVNDAGTTIDTVRYNDQWPWPAAADGIGSSLELVNPNDPNDDARNWRGSTTGMSGNDLYQHNALVFSHRHYNNADDVSDRYRICEVPIAVDPARTLQSVQLPPPPPTGNIFFFGLTLFDGVSYTYINLTPYVDRDGFSFDSNRSDGNLGGNNANYPAEELPSSGGYTACQAPGHGNVRWLTPNTTNGTMNTVWSNAQVIPVPAGQYIRAHFLAMLRGTNLVDTYVTLNYTTGSSANQPFEITQWHMNVALPTYATSRATPGTQNSTYAVNTPPYIHDIVHSPASPNPAQSATVTARVEDTNGIAQATLVYSVNEGTTQTATMSDDGAHGDGAAGDGVYGATIPAQANECIVAYWITARDGVGATERFPYAVEPEQALSYFVYNGAVSTNLPIEWLFISAANKAQLDASPSSDETVPATFVDSDRRVYYRIQVRYRGAWARSWPKKCWKIYFNRGNEFNGRATIDLNSNLNDEILMREHLCYEIFRFSSYPYCETRLIQFRLASGAASQFQGVYVEVEQPGNDFLQRNGLDPDGSLYKAVDNGVYPPRSNESSQPLNLYLSIYEKKTREWEDYSDLITWCQGIDTATRTATVFSYLRQSTDIWRLGEYLGLNVLCANWDHVGKNHYDLRDTRTNKWVQLPWDMDRTLGEYTSPGYRTDQRIDYGRRDVAGPGGMYSFLQDCYFEEPRLLVFHYRILRRLCNLVFTEERMHAVVDRMRALMGNDAEADYTMWHGPGAPWDWSGSYPTYASQWTFWRTTRDYVRERRNYILSNLPAEGDVVINEFLTSNTRTLRDEAGDYDDWVELYNPKSTTVSLGGCYLTDNLSSPTKWRIPDGTNIGGHGRLLIWCDGETGEGPLHTNFRLSDQGEQIGLFDTNANGNLPIDWWTFGPQVADVSVGRNGDGQWAWVAYTTPTARTANPVRAVGTPTVRINEWLAGNRLTNRDEHGDYDDWVELYNYGSEPVCIGGRFLTNGLAKHDSWMIPYCTVIAPHGFLVVWCDKEPDDGPVHTNYRLDALLGEEIALYDLNTATLIHSMRFGPQQPDISQGLYPDGAATSYTLDYPTPGAPNVLAMAPAAPSALRAVAVSSSQINLSWADNSNNETGFKIERKTGPTGSWSQITTTTANVFAYPNAGLLPNTTYFYRVRAYNATGSSPFSNEASTRTLDLAPAAPLNLRATVVSMNRIDLSWTDNSNNEVGFRIERRIGPTGSWSQITTTTANVSAYTDGSVLPNTTYFYRVQAYNAAGNSSYSNVVSQTTPSVSRARHWELYRP